jgi:TPR repeat protein
MLVSVLRAAAILALAAALIWPSERAFAIEVRCIEASKYKYIWKLFNDDRERFAEVFQVQKFRLPEPEMCRAVMLSGLIGGQEAAVVDEHTVQRELTKLIQAIERSNGWLAEIYLSSPGGEIQASMRLGELVRIFWLKTRAVDNGPTEYLPDFVGLSAANEQDGTPIRAQQPLEVAGPIKLARSAYEKATRGVRRITLPDGQRRCASGCSAIHAGGIERKGTAYVHQGRGVQAKVPKAKSGTHLYTLAEEQAFHDSYLQHMDAGSDAIKKSRITAPTTVAPVQSPRYPGEVLKLMTECDLDYGRLNEEEVRSRAQLKKTARRSSEAQQFELALSGIQAQKVKAETCFAGVLERGRLANFAKHCPEGRCNVQAISLSTDFNLYLGLAQVGNAAAQGIVGNRYANGEGVAQDFAEALKWYRRAADQGDDAAQFNLGAMYANGQGVAQDFAEALKWFRQAAEQGLADAQFNLGAMYANGRGVAQDFAEALKWYRLAAEQGLAGAQNNLGNMYANGRGVARDSAEAAKWYRLAADQGDGGGQLNLGEMYASGRGVPRNLVEALKWFLIAAAADEHVAKAWKKRDQLVQSMTPAEIQEAERLAREWTAAHKK